jgi:hypothetical protein
MSGEKTDLQYFTRKSKRNNFNNKHEKQDIFAIKISSENSSKRPFVTSTAKTKHEKTKADKRIMNRVNVETDRGWDRNSGKSQIVTANRLFPNFITFEATDVRRNTSSNCFSWRCSTDET